MSFAKRDIEALIEIVQQYPVLWNWTLKGYSNRSLKLQVWQQITDRMKAFKPELTFEIVKKKWRVLRCNYMAERRKVLLSKKNGAGEDDLYVPTLHYYDKMRFLNGFLKDRPTYLQVDDQENPLRVRTTEEVQAEVIFSDHKSLEDVAQVDSEIVIEEDPLALPQHSSITQTKEEILEPVIVETPIPCRTSGSKCRKKKKSISPHKLIESATATLHGLKRQQERLMDMTRGRGLEELERKRQREDPNEETLNGFLTYLRGRLRLARKQRRYMLYEKILKVVHEFFKEEDQNDSEEHDYV